MFKEDQTVKIAADALIHALEHRHSDFWMEGAQMIDKSTGLRYRFNSCICELEAPYELEFEGKTKKRVREAVKKWKAADVVLRSGRAIGAESG